MSQLVEIVHRASTNPATPWVLFHNGTVVYLPLPEEDLAAQASRLLAEWGPVSAGGPAGDFGVTTIRDGTGWIVSCHHSDIFTFLGRHEVPKWTPDVQIGLLGREKRDQDGNELGIAHVYPGSTTDR